MDPLSSGHKADLNVDVEYDANRNSGHCYGCKLFEAITAIMNITVFVHNLCTCYKFFESVCELP